MASNFISTHTHTPTSAVHQQLVSQATKTPVASNRHRASWLYLPPPLTESSWPNTMHAEQYIALAKVLATLYPNRERETGRGKQGGGESSRTCEQLLVETLIGN